MPFWDISRADVVNTAGVTSLFTGASRTPFTCKYPLPQWKSAIAPLSNSSYAVCDQSLGVVEQKFVLGGTGQKRYRTSHSRPPLPHDILHSGGNFIFAETCAFDLFNFL